MASTMRTNETHCGNVVWAPGQEWEGPGLAATLPLVVPFCPTVTLFVPCLACRLRDSAPGLSEIMSHSRILYA
ncbi:hypothetical protein E2562_020842 [Oryza meyeriana var. granulata]|uniref:Uncharacterized protein n=1 Tax=Oryza meyeriana var. granulata TaxID=110450 RepID=A0A6G1FAH1_9ORYZ|nr:hypothetical protein E2562_020842 [Oryza meyeriana var. granulata]